MVLAREALVGKEDWRASMRGLVRERTDMLDTGPRQEAGGSFLRVEAIPFRRVSRCPNEVDRDSGGYLATSLGVRRGIPWMKPSFNARRKVEREGEPKARCQ